MLIDLESIVVEDGRMREDFDDEQQASLMESLQTEMGLMQPIVVVKEGEVYKLVAGERRLRAVKTLQALGAEINFAGEKVPLGKIPVTVADNLSTLELLRAELEENTERQNFSFLEIAKARARIAKLEEQLLEEKKPKEERKPKIGFADITPEAMGKAAERVFEKSGAGYTQNIKDSIKMAHAMEEDEELAKKLTKAKNFTEGKKVLKKHEKEKLYAKMALAAGVDYRSDDLEAIHGDCLEEMAKLEKKSYDVCITDPIYGIGANNFGTSDQRALSFGHTYDDSYERWQEIMPKALKAMTRLMKVDAHIYVAHDLRRHFELREMLERVSDPHNPWIIPNYPVIQYKKEGGRVPHPGYTFRRSYELWMYAYRGDKQEHAMLFDVQETRSRGTETHGAGKPVDLLKAFLKRSCLPGEKCLDFMAGSGSILEACHESSVKCTAIEIDDTAYGRCVDRLKSLKEK